MRGVVRGVRGPGAHAPDDALEELGGEDVQGRGVEVRGPRADPQPGGVRALRRRGGFGKRVWRVHGARGEKRAAGRRFGRQGGGGTIGERAREPLREPRAGRAPEPAVREVRGGRVRQVRQARGAVGDVRRRRAPRRARRPRDDASRTGGGARRGRGVRRAPGPRDVRARARLAHLREPLGDGARGDPRPAAPGDGGSRGGGRRRRRRRRAETRAGGVGTVRRDDRGRGGGGGADAEEDESGQAPGRHGGGREEAEAEEEAGGAEEEA